MKKAGADPKVKKTLLRNYEQRFRSLPKAVHESDAGPSTSDRLCRNKKVLDLDAPALCSSETLANYLADVKKSVAPVCIEGLDNEKAEFSAKITKKLNFHFNDRIYKNLVELNTDVAKSKSKRDNKRTIKNAPIKRDVEPNIEDFCQDEKENDLCPHIPDIKPKHRPVRTIEDGRLHRLIASFEKF